MVRKIWRCTPWRAATANQSAFSRTFACFKLANFLIDQSSFANSTKSIWVPLKLYSGVDLVRNDVLKLLLQLHTTAFIENDYCIVLWSILIGQNIDILYRYSTKTVDWRCSKSQKCYYFYPIMNRGIKPWS